jgi:ABC-type Zn uptake system ZnuABC Zn-binding protein ZnuA
MLKIYGELLTQANVKRDLIAVLPQAVETLKSTFRAVVKTGQTIKSVNEKTGKTAELVSVWVYHGSSKFNTKEMYDLINIAIMKCSELGIQDSELLSIKNEYKGVK